MAHDFDSRRSEDRRWAGRTSTGATALGRGRRPRLGPLGLLILSVCSCTATKHDDGSDADGGDALGAADGDGGEDALACGVPGSFAWSSTGAVLAPISDPTHDLVAIKDPSVVYFGDAWHVFASSVSRAGTYSIVYLTFPDWQQAASAPIYYLDQTPGLAGYHAAPQVFYFSPQNKWYLIYQSGPPQYSVADSPGDPTAWTPPASFFAAEPDIVRTNKGTGGWLDFWTICDAANCHLFFSDDNGNWYRSQTAITDFPHGFGAPVLVMHDPIPAHLFEASNVYKMKGTDSYLAMIEVYDPASSYHRYFRSWTATSLDGTWTPLQDTYAMPFASYANVTFTEQPPWTRDISHGEMIRDGYDETLTVDPCKLQFLYQGLDPTMTALPYNSLPWRLGLLTKTN